LGLAAFLSAALSSAAADFNLTDTAGRPHSLALHRGKWVLVNFWATWCPPCIEEIPELSALDDAHKGRDLVVIGVAADDEPADVRKFVAKRSVRYPVVIADETAVQPFGDVSGLPTSFLYDPRGRQVLHRVGPVTRRDIERYLTHK
jgi:thiol-disulfide isomerase/thioredoxin